MVRVKGGQPFRFRARGGLFTDSVSRTVMWGDSMMEQTPSHEQLREERYSKSGSERRLYARLVAWVVRKACGMACTQGLWHGRTIHSLPPSHHPLSTPFAPSHHPCCTCTPLLTALGTLPSLSRIPCTLAACTVTPPELPTLPPLELPTLPPPELPILPPPELPTLPPPELPTLPSPELPTLPPPELLLSQGGSVNPRPVRQAWLEVRVQDPVRGLRRYRRDLA